MPEDASTKVVLENVIFVLLSAEVIHPNEPQVVFSLQFGIFPVNFILKCLLHALAGVGFVAYGEAEVSHGQQVAET